FDGIICADVLEHMPFEDLKKNMENFFQYLTPDGRAFITIPHRRGRIMIVSPFSYHKPIILTLPAWLRGSIKSIWQQWVLGKTWIDPHHCWEIDERNYPIRRVEKIFKNSGFYIVSFQKLLQVDFWVLSKPKT
ncbi:class I SAM-dependent methyltransferase, partial [Candidatus Uhrbacteria bacterium]|nr:class I SAM-dependent methyltransferase [Candidatus Uhrbacteria bacterium]